MRDKSAFSIKRRTATAALARVVVARAASRRRARVQVRALIANCIMPCRMQICLSPAAKRNCPRPDGARRAQTRTKRARVTVTAHSRVRARARSRVACSSNCAPSRSYFSSDSFPASLPVPLLLLLLLLLAIAVAIYESLPLFFTVSSCPPALPESDHRSRRASLSALGDDSAWQSLARSR